MAAPRDTYSSTWTNLPRMAHVAHLRVSSCGGAGRSCTGVNMRGALLNLLSLQTFANVRLAVNACVKLPRLTHVALFHGTELLAWRTLMSAAKSTLVSLLDYYLTLDDVRFLAQCQRLRVLHFTTSNADEPMTYRPTLSNIPSLRDVGIYSRQPLVADAADVRASMARFSMGGPATYPSTDSRLTHFTVADMSRPFPLPAGSSAWHSTTAVGADGGRTRCSFFG